MEDPYSLSFFKENKVIILFALIGCVFIGIGIYFLLPHSSQDRGVLLEKAASVETPSQASASAQISVDIEGAVVNPGVYKLPKDSRLQDGLVAAGGVSAIADKEVIAKSLNLAQKLTDGAKIYIPKQGEVMPAQGSGSVQGTSTSSMININIASSAELDKLSGIGAVTAQKIIDGRPYGDINELLSKKIITKSVFEKIKDNISVF